MSRVYACPVILETDRTDPETGESLPDLQYAALARVAGVTRCRAAIAVSMEGSGRGRSRHPWAICWVEADDWTAVDNESDTHHLTAEILDDEVPNRVLNQLRNGGVLTRQEADDWSGTVRELIRFLLRKHYPGASDERIREQFGGLI